jgi:hypothetical protein
MFYYFLPPPIEYAQTYEQCQLESLKRQLEVEKISIYPDSIGKQTARIFSDYFDSMCFNSVREQELKKREQELRNKKKIQQSKHGQINTKVNASEWGENVGKITCQILAAYPTIQTWDHFNFIANQNSYFLAAIKNFKVMKDYSSEDINAENDAKAFQSAMLKKQSQYQNCSERLNALQ